MLPKTHDYEIVCPDTADAQESFSNHYVKPPENKKAIPVIMDKGDVLFFNGNIIHGYYRNRRRINSAERLSVIMPTLLLRKFILTLPTLIDLAIDS